MIPKLLMNGTEIQTLLAVPPTSKSCLRRPLAFSRHESILAILCLTAMAMKQDLKSERKKFK